MNRIQLTITALLFALSGCAKPLSAQDADCAAVARAVRQSQAALPPLMEVLGADFSEYASEFYGIPESELVGGAVLYADGVEAAEIAVVLAKDKKAAASVQTALASYKERRAAVFAGYAPKQAALVKSGAVAASGRYVALLIVPDASKAKRAFSYAVKNGVQGTSSSAPPSESARKTTKTAPKQAASQGYDHDAVLLAWRTGEESSLSAESRDVLAAARAVFISQVKDGMSDYEKELALHDWITDNTRFDYGVFGRTATALGADTPYGVLVRHEAMCHGYSAAFQLFMDMAGIECVTVFGTPDGNGTRHSWNMVRLDGEWYIVDTAWDDPIGSSPTHRFFNVTTKSIRGDGIHRWDKASVPEATGTKWRYKN